MWHFIRPTEACLHHFRTQHGQANFSPAVHGLLGVTRHWQVSVAEAVPGFDVDQRQWLLGHGEAAYHAAVEGLRSWAVAPSWAEMSGEQVPGSLVTLRFHLAGLHWLSLGRIVYRVEETDTAGAHLRSGFAYATLPAHVECGEERFTVALLGDGSVVYELMAFSKPRYWTARLGKPLARHWQRRFGEQSQAALKAYVAKHLG